MIRTPFVLAAFALFFAGVFTVGGALQGATMPWFRAMGFVMEAVGDILGLMVGGFLAIGTLRAVERHIAHRAERRAEILDAMGRPREDSDLP